MAQLYVALIRGINVGGNNPVPMVALREVVVTLGAADVVTYIQSGNVLFDGGGVDPATWTERLEGALPARFGFTIPVVVKSHDELRMIVRGAPPGFGTEPDAYREDVIFLKGPTTATEAAAQLNPREGVDAFTPGDGVIYSSRLAARAAQSRLSKIASLPVYKEVTIRNWRTTTTLLRMLDERA